MTKRLNQRRPTVAPKYSGPQRRVGRFIRKRKALSPQKQQRRKQKKQKARDGLNPRQRRALAKIGSGNTYMVGVSSVGVSTTSLKALYRMVHANVAFYYPKLNVEAVADPTNQPALGPTGFAAYFLWAVISAARMNSSATDKVPDPNTLPNFNLDFRIPNALALFIIAWLRNKGRTYDIYNELPNLTAILTGSMANNTSFNATTYSLTASPYGDVIQPSDPSATSEFMFNSAAASTFTVDDLVAAGDVISSLLGSIGGTVPFHRIFREEDGLSRVIPYASPVLFANPVADGFDCRMKLQEEVAALIIDYSVPNANSDGIIIKPYPMANQDRFVLGAVNLLNHCKCPPASYTKKEWKFPKDVRKILDPGRSAHRWHALGRIKTLRVCATTNTSCWLSVQKNICEQLCVAYANTALTNSLALECNEMNFVIQAYIFSHLLDWSWMHYTRLGKLLTGQFLNAVTSGAGPDIKSIPVPQNIAELVREWRPIVVAGQVMVPDVPTVAMSTFANFITFGTGTTFTGVNTVTFQNTASPNGYNFAMTGLYSTNIVPSANFTAAAYSLNGNTLSNNSFGVTAGPGISATNQSPSLPIKFTNLFIADWKSKFIARSNQKMFNMEYPILGDIGMLGCTDMYQRTNWFMGSGWLSIRLDYIQGQTMIAPDRVNMWKSVQYARVNALTAAPNGGRDYYNYKLTISSGDGGILANVEAFAKDDLGQEYNSLLTGMESNPKLTDFKMKPWMALDNIVSRLYDQRAGAAFEEFRTKDAVAAYLLSMKEQSLHMSALNYSEDNDLFKPNSLSGWLSFLSGVEATYNTGKFIFTDIYKTFSNLFNLRNLTLV